MPTDFSEPSQRAADAAIDLAGSYEAEILLVFVDAILASGVAGDMFGSAAAVQFLAENQEAARKLLERERNRIEKRGIPCRSFLAEGHPAEQIVAAAKRHRADMIVMGTHGRTGLSHLLVGSVAEHVVRTAPCPVLTMRTEEPAKPKPKPKKSSPRRKSGD